MRQRPVNNQHDRFARSQRITGGQRRLPLDLARKTAIVSGILSIVVILVILQLWLFTATMNAYLGGDTSIPLPAALVSLVCLGLIGGLIWYLYRLED